MDLPAPVAAWHAIAEARDPAGLADLLADDALSFDWGYEMPTKAQWERDQHYALCWAPS